ncbi:hypothetical protein UFOVP111_94 [uncultured Caudovirales phage]|uniref:Major tropism determinant N-terminal domain-containing protein n=1 Tax=uncultured Caudovirales phage TaxID=2100421 RepID=A0A6J5L6I8_9CAUD|nr:hypothetical protein UFOVP111_94 [uncultured Caudovirales phage]
MTQIQIRRGPSTGTGSWAANSTVVLAAGEFGLETDTGNMKLGDGSTPWATLGYFHLGNALTFSTAFTNDTTVSFDGRSTLTVDLPATINRNAATATTLAATKKINGTAFDGSADVVIGGAIYGTTINASSGTFTKIYASPLASPPAAPQLGDIWISW